MSVTKEIIDGKEYFHVKASDSYGYDYYVGNFSFGFSGKKVVVEFDAWGRSWPYCCYAEIALWVNEVKSSYSSFKEGSCSQNPMIYYNSGFGISETKKRYRITSDGDLDCGYRVIFAVYDIDRGWFVPIAEFKDFWIFQFRPVRSVETEEGYSITYEIYNHSRRACKLPVLVKYTDTGEVVSKEIISFSNNQLYVTKSFAADRKVRPYPYKYDYAYYEEGVPFYRYEKDPTTLATELAVPDIESKIDIEPKSAEMLAEPYTRITVPFIVTNNSDYNVKLVIDLTVNGNPVNVPKTVDVPAHGSKEVSWQLQFSEGEYIVCPVISGILLG